SNGTGEIETPRFWLSIFGEASGNLVLRTAETTIEGRVRPGNSPGTIEATGDFELTGTSQLVMELAGTTPDLEHDQLLIGGQAALGGELEVTLIDGFTPSAGDVFDLFDWGSVVGTFDSVVLPALLPSQMW